MVVDLEDLVMHPYCGPDNLKLTLAYTWFEDLHNGDFVLVRLHDPFLCPCLDGKNIIYITMR
jgi:hypothetical protein